ncbi:MAG: DUF721 domain-containing protein [Acidobacteria bacterium]|nr:DUF721 domain-containing protein [Acidobacteriota bacterium]
MRRLAIVGAWSRAVGPTLGAVSRPSKLARGCLIVDVGSAVWLRELEHLRAVILSRLNEWLAPESIDALAFSLRPGLHRSPPTARVAGASIDSVVDPRPVRART